MLFDSHAHYDDSRFDRDREALLASMQENGVDLIMNVGADMGSSKRSTVLAKRYPFVYAAVGVHPHEVKSMNEGDLQTLRELSTLPKVCAIGEIGLDYYYDNSPRDLQKQWFVRQIELALELEKPIIIHERDAHGDCMDILRRYDFSGRGGVMHCFSGSVEMAKEIIKMGLVISIAGPVTFKNAKMLHRVAAEVPMDKILIETDCPYLTPEPNRGQRNSSLNVRYVAQKIADLREISIEEVARASMENAKNLFGITD